MKESKTIRIAVIGAGLSGLTTGYLLKKHSNKLDEKIKIDIKVFEASDCVGGRVRTLRNFSDGLYAEAGGMALTDTEGFILSLVKEMGIKTLSKPANKKNCFHLNGTWNNGEAISDLISSLADEIQKLQQIIQSPDDWSTKKHCTLDKLDSISIIEFLEQKGRNSSEIRALLSSTLIGLYSDNLDKLSALDGLRFLSQYLPCKTVYSLEGGNDRLPHALADALNSAQQTVFLHSPVKEVARLANQWQVSFRCEKTQPQLFDYVVMATPLTAIQPSRPNSINLPDLSKARLDALNTIPYTQSVARVYCEVNDRFWGNEPATAITEKSTLWIEDHTTMQNNQHGILEAHTCGNVAELIQQSDNPNKTGEEQIASVYGKKFKQHLISENTATISWSQEEFQQGNYPYFAIGQRHLITELKKPVGGLFFAGDYTSSDAPISMNGAIQSAHRVVNQELWPTIYAAYGKGKRFEKTQTLEELTW